MIVITIGNRGERTKRAYSHVTDVTSSAVGVVKHRALILCVTIDCGGKK